MNKDEIVSALTSLSQTAERDADRIHALEVIARIEGLVGAGVNRGNKVSDNVIIMTEDMQNEIAAEIAADDDAEKALRQEGTL